MKHLRKLTAIAAAVLLLVCVCLPASASIGFDAETVFDSVFVISAGSKLGSGFAIGTDCVITNVHVVEDAYSITVRAYDGSRYSAEIFCQDAALDIAVLRVSGANFTPLPCADIESAKIGDDIYTIGAPKSLSYTLTKGVISTKSREVQGNDYIQIDAPINEGNSGGPLLNEQGEVLGINTLKSSEGEGLGFSIPIAQALHLLEKAGVSLNSDGTVVGTLSGEPSPIQTEPTSPFEPDNPESPTQTPETEPNGQPHVIVTPRTDGTVVWLIVIGAVLVLGCLLTVLLLYRRRRNIVKPYDPSERTDFEIEIEE